MKGLSKMDKDSIEEKAQELLRKYNYESGTVKIVHISKEEGFSVGAYTPNSESEDGFLLIDPEVTSIVKNSTNKIIGVNSARSSSDMRFIIAHELGHYKLHYENQNDNKLYEHRENKKGKNGNENDADYFAACLLMPNDIFLEMYETYLADFKDDIKSVIDKLSEYFEVSTESVSRRIIELKVV